MSELSIDEGATRLDDVYIDTDQLLDDLFNEHDTLNQILVLADDHFDDSKDWQEVVGLVMVSLGYEQVASENTYNGANDLSYDLRYEVWRSPGAHGNDWIQRSDLNDSGHIPENGPEWAAEVLDDLDEDMNETLPHIVVIRHLSMNRFGDSSNGPVAGYFEGDYTVPTGSDLCVEWHLEPCDEDDGEAADFARTANDGGYLNASEATYHLSELVEVVEDEDGNNIPFNLDKGAFKVRSQKGFRFWAHPGRHYFGQ